MCIARLNVSTQPCSHRWFQLVRSCQPHHNLANCSERLRLEGWETRNEGCPWCDEQDQVDPTTHRPFGSVSSASSSTGSPTSPELGPTRSYRSGSGGTISSLSRQSSSSSDNDRGQRHRDMNDRLHVYLTSSPHDVLPSARKNYPTSGSMSVLSSAVEESTSASSDTASLRGSASLLGKGWRKSVRFSQSMFKP